MTNISAREAVKEALDRAEACRSLNAVAELDPTAMAQAEALDLRVDHDLPLFGIPVLVKDNIDVKGLHTTAGSLALADNIASADALIIQNLRKNGAVILGKTNMTEFANYTTAGMPAGYSSRGGQVRHALDPSLSPSGSSSGSGVAVCAGVVPAAVGTDTSFSVIACAQENGICGLKPPAGTLSSEGIIPIARTLDSAGAMAMDFRGALRLYSAMRDTALPAVEPTAPQKLKIAVNTANRDMVSAGQMAFLETALKRFRACGASISELYEPYPPLLSVLMKWEFRPHLEDYLRKSGASRKTLREIVEFYETNPVTMMKYGDTLLRGALDETPGGLAGKPYLDALRDRAQTMGRVRGEIEGFDAVLMTGPTSIMHYCGLPSVTVAGSAKNDAGVRRGLIMYGTDELRLYAAALVIEKILTGETI